MDDDNEYDGADISTSLEIPSYPFVESAAIADAMEMAAQIAESSASFLRGYALRLAAGHNFQVEQEEAMLEAAAEIESMTQAPKFQAPGDV